MLHRRTPLSTRSRRILAPVAAALAALLAIPLIGLDAAPAVAADPPFTTSFETADVAAHPVPPSEAYEPPVNVQGGTLPASSLTSQISAVTASGENPPGETAVRLFDGDAGSKWLTRTRTGWVQMDFAAPVTVVTYALTTANDSADRNPRDWTLQGSDDGETWVDVDAQVQQLRAAAPFTQVEYALAAPATHQHFRLQITANDGAPLLQLADLDLRGEDTGAVASPMRTTVGSGPASGYNIASNRGFDGLAAVLYRGQHLGDGPASSTNVLVDDLDVTIAADSELSYAVLPTLYALDLQYPSTYVALDLVIETAAGETVRMSDAQLVDQYGFPASAIGQGEAHSLYADQWNQIRVPLGSLEGGTITQVLLEYDNPGGSAATRFSGWVDDLSIAPATPLDAETVLDHVDTRRGTNSSGGFSRGNNIPATAVPNGFNFLVPMTNATSQSWLYDWQSRNTANNLPALEALGISHEPSPWMGDRAQLAIMPSLDTAQPSGTPASRRLEFSHDDEVATPEEYAVDFVNGLSAAMTPTDHGGIMRFDFPDGADLGTVMVDQVQGQSGLRISADGVVSGWVEGGSGLSAGSSRMFVYGTFTDAPVATGMASQRTTAAWARFETGEEPLELRFATSFISLDQAQRNLDLEVTGSSYGEVRDAARDLWLDRLEVVDLSASNATEAELVTFYSGLYRLNLYPNSQSENTGTAEAPVWQYASPVRATEGAATATETNAVIMDGQIFVNNGFWDTYRTVWPLYSFLYPEVTERLVDGFVQQYRDGGWIARWSSPGYADLMTGTSSDASFAEAYTSGAISTGLAEQAYEAALRNATVSSASDTTLVNPNAVGRKGITTSQFLAYTASTTGQSVSWGLEGNINDAAMADMAAMLATDPDVDPARQAVYAEHAVYFDSRASDFVNMFDPNVGFFQAREPDGTWQLSRDEYDPTDWQNHAYTEAPGWTFAFHAPFDVPALAALYGGSDGLDAKLEEFYSTPETAQSSGIHEAFEARDVRMGQFGFSNQVSHHTPYISAANGDPTTTQEVVREVLSRLYVGSEIGQGYAGDEDNGETSSWYVFSALGFYPLALGSGEYVIGSPLFDHAVVHRDDAFGGDLTITAPGNDDSTIYVGGVSLDGEALDTPVLSQAALQESSSLAFSMQAEPSAWGSSSTDEEVYEPLVDATNPYLSTIGAGLEGPALGGLVDDNSTSEVTFGTETPTLQMQLRGGSSTTTIYTITNGATGSSPTAWTLSGSNDGTSWTTVDERADVVFPWATQTMPFVVQDPGAYAQYRLEVLASTDGPTTLAELELLGEVDPGPFAVTPAEGLTAWVGTELDAPVATVLGTPEGTEPTATVDFLDGEGPVEAELRALPVGGGYEVVAPHAFDLAGVFTAYVTVTAGDLVATARTQVTVARPSTTAEAIAALANVNCFADASAGGSCDGQGAALDLAQLQATGLAFGSPETVDLPVGTGTGTFTYVLPALPGAANDTIVPDGQVLPVRVGADATHVSFVGTANEGEQSTTLTLTYADGSTQDVPVTFGDWVGGTTSPSAGNTIVATVPGRLTGPGSTDTKPSSLFATAPVALSTGADGAALPLVSVTFPPSDGTLASGQVHVAAVAFDGTLPEPTLQVAPVAPTLEASVDAELELDLATIDGVDAAADEVTAVVSWGDGTPSDIARIDLSGAALDAPTSVEASLQAEIVDGIVRGSHAYLAEGTYTISVTVDDGTASTMTTIPIVVGPAVEPVPTITVPPGAVAPGAIVPVDGTGFTPGEDVTVTFSGGGDPIGVEATDGTFRVEVPVGDVADGDYVVTATGDESATPATASITVETPAVPSSTTLQAALSTVEIGDDIVLTATVAVGGSAATAGSVTFSEGAEVVGTAPVVAGTATVTIDAPSLGDRTFVASFSGGDGVAASASGPVTVSVVADSGADVETYAGASRYDTNVLASQAHFEPGAPVYIAAGGTFPDALAAGPAAAHDDASLLLVPGDRILDGTLVELDRLQPPSITIVGGPTTVSDGVEDALAARFPDADVTRIAGVDRFDTAARIATEVFGEAETAFIASGEVFPDALSASGVAAAIGDVPVLLSARAGLPDVSAEALHDLGVEQAWVVGGSPSLSYSVIVAARMETGSAERISGPDRFATNAALVERFVDVEAADGIVVATGINFPDALSASALVGATGDPLLLTYDACAAAPVSAVIAAIAPDVVRNVGGPPSLLATAWSTTCS
ncbi:alpha-1,2-mannosidase, putative [Agrococcus jejuensis]|uniref:Alpha-1,2-mannosidase, putative n=1 Tax=Agrococcus jejuensis TaxID=399736 RepID=A0A1G8E761_9MICO|nr:alpha-1,2-mannosidase, putative [Agrococcus jejuensis]